MKELPDLKQLTEEAKDALIVLLWEEIQKLQQGQQKKPKKTATNSSVPPAQGFKPEIKIDKKEGKRIASLGRAAVVHYMRIQTKSSCPLICCFLNHFRRRFPSTMTSFRCNANQYRIVALVCLL